MLRTHDDWERLVAAVLKKQQLWELFHAHSRSPSVLSEASSSDVSRSSSFREIDTSSAYWQELEDAVARLKNRVQKLVLVSDFFPAFDLEDANLTSLELLGTGTFSNTYMGDVNDGVKIVVKRVDQLGVSEEEFKRSMDVIGRLNHENVVALRAYYCSEDERLMLYDYYTEGSVYQLLHGKINEPPTNYVGWETRLRIAIGAAHGLASIHARMHVHGNFKSSNIFLNQESYGTVSDLGITYLTSAKFMKNAYCYAPEVKNSTQNVSQEADVYSFGILLFELLTRKSPVGTEAVDLVKLMKSVKTKQMTPKVFDAYLLLYPTIREQMVKVLQIGISCVVKSPKKRPKMSEVAKMLDDLNVRRPQKRADGENLLVFVHHKNESTSEDPFNLETLLGASAEVLGKGTFGTSYKARLEIGLIVRVKRLKDVGVTSVEFQQHLHKINRIKHKHCATPMAYYFSKDEVLFVYDYYDEDSLYTLLHGTRKPVPWEVRLRIALTAAKGICHIHKRDSSRLVHGNIRSSNILLDRKNSAIIADTALSKVMEPIRHSVLKRHGFIAPEVRDTRDVSQSSDVYGFGIILLELLMRKSLEMMMMIDEQATSLVSWLMDLDLEKTLDEVFDAELDAAEETVEVLQLAIDCIATVPEQRPRMSEVVNRLQEISRIYDDDEEPESSIEYGSERWIGMRLEDALEDHISRLTI